ncbi:hypothetical protein [Helicobacter mehlei]|uniref:hypothetical protein n=1 Tax=Helicobacter mehlei TaxID=2316080 RepID=UPI0013CE34E3|nr:hypothetical protein [Helicobacter mehlei]
MPSVSLAYRFMHPCIKNFSFFLSFLTCFWADPSSRAHARARMRVFNLLKDFVFLTF